VLITAHAFIMIFLRAVSVVFVYIYKYWMVYITMIFMKILRLFECLIKRLTYFRRKRIKDNSMSRKRKWGAIDNLKKFTLAKLAKVRLGLPKFKFLHGLHGRYFYYQRDIDNTTEIKESWNVDKLLNCKLVYSNETNDDLKLKSQILANSRVILVKSKTRFMGLPKFCKKYGNGESVVAVKVRFYTTTVTCSEGKGTQSISHINLNRSTWCDSNKCNNIFIYDNLLDTNFIWNAYTKIYKIKDTNNKTLYPSSNININYIIEKLKNHSFTFKPLKQIYLKNSKGKKHHLSIPSLKDKVVLQAIQMTLEKVYEPIFLTTNHDFRTEQSIKSTFKAITKWSDVDWFLEGNLNQCFHSRQHHLLIKILNKKINNKQFLDLCWKAIKIKYINFSNINIKKNNIISTAQENTLASLLARILLHELDLFVNTLIISSKKSGPITKENSKYKKLHTKIWNLSQCFLPSWRYKLLSKEKQQQQWAECLQLEKLKQQLPLIVKENGFRVYYTRYATNFLIGVRSKETFAKKLTLKLNKFLQSKLRLSLFKTKIKSAITNRAYFLGTYVKVITSKAWSQPNRNDSFIQINQKIKAPQKYIHCLAPIKNIVKKLWEHGICKIYNFKNYRVIPTKKTSWIHLSINEIIRKYNYIWNSLANYYYFVYNRPQLTFIHYLLLHSAACTLMNKLKLSSRAKVFKKFGRHLLRTKKKN
jgi:retron-type reverse transcriptase